jgi:hypothetical protein
LTSLLLKARHHLVSGAAQTYPILLPAQVERVMPKGEIVQHDGKEGMDSCSLPADLAEHQSEAVTAV